MKSVWILFQTDIWKTKSSRVYFGVFETQNMAIDEAKTQGLYSSQSEVEVIEATLNIFEEL